jgi:hypothetical protein
MLLLSFDFETWHLGRKAIVVLCQKNNTWHLALPNTSLYHSDPFELGWALVEELLRAGRDYKMVDSRVLFVCKFRFNPVVAN